MATHTDPMRGLARGDDGAASHAGGALDTAFDAMWQQLQQGSSGVGGGGTGPDRAKLFESFKRWAIQEGAVGAGSPAGSPHAHSGSLFFDVTPVVTQPAQAAGKGTRRRNTCPQNDLPAPPREAPPSVGLFAPPQALPEGVEGIVVDTTVQEAFMVRQDTQDHTESEPMSPTPSTAVPAAISPRKKRHRASVTNAPPTIIGGTIKTTTPSALSSPTSHDGPLPVSPLQRQQQQQLLPPAQAHPPAHQPLSPAAATSFGAPAELVSPSARSNRSSRSRASNASESGSPAQRPPDPPRKASGRRPGRLQLQISQDDTVSLPTAHGVPASFRYQDIDDQWALVIFCADTGAIRLWSKAMESQTGTSAECAHGTDITVFLPSVEDQTLLWETVRVLKQEHERRASHKKPTGAASASSPPAVALLSSGGEAPLSLPASMADNSKPRVPTFLAAMSSSTARPPTIPLIDQALLPQNAGTSDDAPVEAGPTLLGLPMPLPDPEAAGISPPVQPVPSAGISEGDTSGEAAPGSQPNAPAATPSLPVFTRGVSGTLTLSRGSSVSGTVHKTPVDTNWPEQVALSPTLHAADLLSALSDPLRTHCDQQIAFLKNDGINKAHMQMRLVLTRGGESVMAIMKPSVEAKSHGYMMWVLEQLEHRIKSLCQLNDSLDKKLSESLEQAKAPSTPEDRDLAPHSPLSPTLQKPEEISEVIRTSRRCLGYIERARRTEFDRWAPLNLRTHLRKMIAAHQSTQEAADAGTCINLHIHDSVTEEIFTDVALFPEMMSALIDRAVESKKEQVVVDVRVVEAFMIVQVIDDGLTLSDTTLEGIDRSDPDAEPTIVGAKCTVEGCLGGELSVEVTAARTLTQRLRTFTKKSRSANASKLKKLREMSLSLKFLSALKRGNSGVGTAGSGLFGVAQRVLNQPKDQGTTVTLKLPRLAPNIMSLGGLAHSVSSRRNAGRGANAPSEEMIRETELALKETREEVQGMGAMPLIKCMLVETHPLYRQAFSSFLWDRSYSISFVNSTQEALALIDSVDLLVIDLDVKTIDVDTILKELIRHSDVQVLVAFGASDQQLREYPATWGRVQLPLLDREIMHALSKLEVNILKGMVQKLKIEEFRMMLSDRKLPWKRGRELGKGSFGRVYEATVEVTGAIMAVKVLPLSSDPEQEKALLNEIQLMSGFCDENIIHYLWGETTETELLIFMEFAGDGCLSSKVPAEGLDEATASTYMEGILRGLSYLHEQGVVHRDIKVANVLLNKGVVKLTDFGCALKKTPDVDDKNKGDGPAQDLAGTIVYMAPEVVQSLEAGTESDIWSVGCLLMALMHGNQPFWHIGSQWPVARYLDNLRPGDTVDIGAEKNDGKFTENVLDFLKLSLCVAPAERSDADQLLLSTLVMSNAAMVRRTTIIESLTSGRKARDDDTDRFTSPLLAEDVESECSSTFSGW